MIFGAVQRGAMAERKKRAKYENEYKSYLESKTMLYGEVKTEKAEVDYE